MVKVEEPEAEMEAGTNEDVAPLGNPLTDKLTVSVNPFNALTETVYGALPPGAMERDAGDTEIAKSGAGLTVTFLVGGFGSVKLALSVTVNVAV